MNTLFLNIVKEMPEKFAAVAAAMAEKDGDILGIISPPEAEEISRLVRNHSILSNFILMLLIDIENEQIQGLPASTHEEENYIKRSIRNSGSLDILNTLYNLPAIKADYDLQQEIR